MLFRSKTKELNQLIKSFENTALKERLHELHSFVDECEYGLAIESLSEWIYEYDVFVNQEQESKILKLSKDFGVKENYHKFIGKNPPYPDLRTEEQKALDERAANVCLENIECFAKKGDLLTAVGMYRRLYNTDLEKAFLEVNKLKDK